MLHAWTFQNVNTIFVNERVTLLCFFKEAKCEGVAWNSFTQDTDTCWAVSVEHENQSSSFSKRRKIYWLREHKSANMHTSLIRFTAVCFAACVSNYYCLNIRNLLTFKFMPCILSIKCLLYTDIYTNKCCKFILKILRHVSVLLRHL